MKKRVLGLALSIMLMLGAVVVPFSALAATDDWKTAYADTVLELASQLNARKSNEYGGMTVALIDFDFDGTPELYVGYLNIDAQMDYYSDEFVYRFNNGSAEKVTINTSNTVYGYSLFEPQYTSQPSGFYLLQNKKSGGYLYVKESDNDEGVGADGYYFSQMAYDKSRISSKLLHSFNLPNYLWDDLFYGEGKEVAKFVEQQRASFFSAYNVVSRNPAKSVFYAGKSLGYINYDVICKVSVSKDDITAMFNSYSPIVPPKKADATGSSQVGSVTLKVRQAPSSEASVVTTLKNAAKVSYYERSGSWVRIKTSSGQEGWVAVSYLCKSPYTMKTGEMVKVFSGTLKLRASGNSTATVLKTLKYGITVKIIDNTTSKTWIKVDNGGTVGWVAASYTGKGI